MTSTVRSYCAGCVSGKQGNTERVVFFGKERRRNRIEKEKLNCYWNDHRFLLLDAHAQHTKDGLSGNAVGEVGRLAVSRSQQERLMTRLEYQRDNATEKEKEMLFVWAE